MHIPNGMLHGAVCPVTAALSVAGVAASTTMALRSKNPLPTAGRFAAVTSLIFAGQMINFPVQGGTSGHLLGGLLAAALLGTPMGVLAVALVVTVQCLIFADGDLAALGANVLNMAILGAGIGGCIMERIGMRADLRSAKSQLGLGIVAWASVVLGALACSIELALSGTARWIPVTTSMAGIHALIGLGEAVITVVICRAISHRRMGEAEQMRPRVTVLTGLAALLIAAMGSPFACSMPDGLEWIADRYGFLKEFTPTFTGFAPHYLLPGIENEALATALAGGLGAVLIFGLAWILARLVRHCSVPTAHTTCSTTYG